MQIGSVDSVAKLISDGVKHFEKAGGLVAKAVVTDPVHKNLHIANSNRAATAGVNDISAAIKTLGPVLQDTMTTVGRDVLVQGRAAIDEALDAIRQIRF